MDRRLATGIAGKQSTILRLSDTIQHLQPQSRRMKRLYKMESFYSLVSYIFLKSIWLGEDSVYVGSLTGEKKCNCACTIKACTTKVHERKGPILPYILNPDQNSNI